ncbi:MAG: hypothetical protein ACK5MF_09980 [Vibrio sp.]|uniref:hypothetical protein n=1 Tax=Vibrio sp. TaxID=678 RepID=UPI003A8A0758
MTILFLLEAAAVLSAFVHPNRIVIYAHGDSLTCRLPATPSSLSMTIPFLLSVAMLGLNSALYCLWGIASHSLVAFATAGYLDIVVIIWIFISKN